MTIHAGQALVDGNWAENVRIELKDDRIVSLVADASPLPGDQRVAALIPGMANLHSHAFQRGFSGLTELRGPTADSFWTWREMMYRFALTLSPDQAQAIATMASIEMLEAGYTRLGEFHYLHHAPDGSSYDDPAEMSARIFAASETSGIALTLLPVFYRHGGFGPAAPGAGQRRFLHDPDSFARLIDACDALARPQDTVGLAPHSLRAATISDINELAAAFPNRPFHIHIAEQVKEVEDCLAFAGARPVEYLFANTQVGPDWCLIHATHLTPQEVSTIANSGAVAGLCPITEANLGDGIFEGAEYQAQRGAWGIGTDSNVQISVSAELRQLEYSQRLALRARNVMTSAGSTGAALFKSALEGGARALGAPTPSIAIGQVADLVALSDPLALGSTGDVLLDRWVFGSDVAVSDVWASGRHLVQNGRHIHRDKVATDYAQALRQVLA